MSEKRQALELDAERREVTGKQVRQLRRDGLVPAVMYGNGFEPVALQLDAKRLGLVLDRARSSALLTINIDGVAPERALVRRIQRNVITRAVQHVDFYRVQMDVSVVADVGLTQIGHAPATGEEGGVLMTTLFSVEIECLPGDLPDSISVDLSTLENIDDSVHVRDLVAPPGVTIRTDGDELVVRVVAPTIEEEVELPGAEEVEVIAKGEEAGEEAGEEE